MGPVKVHKYKSSPIRVLLIDLMKSAKKFKLSFLINLLVTKVSQTVKYRPKCSIYRVRLPI